MSLSKAEMWKFSVSSPETSCHQPRPRGLPFTQSPVPGWPEVCLRKTTWSQESCRGLLGREQGAGRSAARWVEEHGKQQELSRFLSARRTPPLPGLGSPPGLSSAAPMSSRLGFPAATVFQGAFVSENVLTKVSERIVGPCGSGGLGAAVFLN